MHYGVSVQWGPNTLLYNTQKVKPAPTGVGRDLQPEVQGQADRAEQPDPDRRRARSTSMKTKPSLGIKDPYELTKAQLNAAVVTLLKQQKPLLKRYWNYATDEIDRLQERRRA